MYAREKSVVLVHVIVVAVNRTLQDSDLEDEREEMHSTSQEYTPQTLLVHVFANGCDAKVGLETDICLLIKRNLVPGLEILWNWGERCCMQHEHEL